MNTCAEEENATVGNTAGFYIRDVRCPKSLRRKGKAARRVMSNARSIYHVYHVGLQALTSPFR